MAKKEFEANVRAEQERGNDEYDTLRRIQNSIIDESAYIRRGLILSHLRSYYTAIYEYYDWLRPHIKKSEMESFEKRIKEAEKIMTAGYKNAKITSRVSRKLWTAFNLFKGIQREFDIIKTKKGMGVKIKDDKKGSGGRLFNE